MYLLFLITQDLLFNDYEDLVGVLGSSGAATPLRIAPNVDAAAGFVLPRPIPSPAPKPTTKATRPISIVAHRGVPLFPVVELAVVFVLPVAATVGFTVKTKAPCSGSPAAAETVIQRTTYTPLPLAFVPIDI